MTDARKVLMIDDSKLIRRLGRSVLERSGFVVWTAENFREVEQIVGEHGVPDMLLVDINMPEMTGDDLVPLLRERIGLHAPVVLFSDIDEDELKQRAMAIGAAGWISKHWGLQRLVQDITDILEWTEALAPSKTPPRNVVQLPADSQKPAPPPDVKAGRNVPTKSAINPNREATRVPSGIFPPSVPPTATQGYSPSPPPEPPTPPRPMRAAHAPPSPSPSASESETRVAPVSPVESPPPPAGNRPVSGTRRLLNEGEEFSESPLRASKAPSNKSRAPAPPPAESGAEPAAEDFEDEQNTPASTSAYTTPLASEIETKLYAPGAPDSGSGSGQHVAMSETNLSKPPAIAGASAASNPATEANSEHKAEPKAEDEGPQILVVDDSDLIRNLVSRALTKAGYRVAIASRFDEISQVLLDIGEPDLILVDINMPDILGDDLVVFFRRRWEITAPIVLFSNVAEGELDYRAKEAGANGWISKRWGIDRLVAEVAAFVPEHPTGT